MSAQTTYETNHQKGFAGQIANLEPKEIVTGIVAAGVTIVPGVVVKRDSATLKTPGNQLANNVVSLGGANSADVLGISVRDLGREGRANTGVINYQETDQFGILRKGYIYCTIPSGGNAGDRVKYNATTGVIDAGAPAAGEVGIDAATLETQTTAGEVGLVRISNFDSLTAGS